MNEFIHHLHPLLAVISVLTFNYKFWRSYTDYDYEISQRSRIFSRVVDVLLLLTGIILAYGFGSSILFDVKWFDYKLLLVVIYIIMGILCLKSKKGSQASLIFYLLGMIAIAGIIYLVKVQPF
ncbi:hypothetical protein GKC56_02810 [Neisseriaceae bacterium PsAf]|nr:hypothetical protein [Neisseriaceae bacterium PsAf]